MEFAEVNVLKNKKAIITVSIWIYLGIAAILFFFIFSAIIGGSAMNGYKEAGRYFVAEHENVTEVSKTIWTISKVSGVLFWVFIPLTPIGGFIIYDVFDKIERRKNKMK